MDQDSRYARYVAEHFPNDCTRESAVEAVSLQRRLLAGAKDGSVVFVTLGYLTNQRDLLASGPDEHSPLGGRDLVRQKVKALVSMGSRYPADMRRRRRRRREPGATSVPIRSPPSR